MSSPASPRQLLRTKDIDLLLLAGCSCLLTLLHHPVLEQLSPAGQANGSSGQDKSVAARSGSTSSTPRLSAFPGVMPSERTRFRLEDDEEAS
jgi:hypothetical protein